MATARPRARNTRSSFKHNAVRLTIITIMTNHKNFGCAMTYHGISINQDGTLDPCCQYSRPDDLPVVGYGNMDYFTSTVRHQMREDARNGIRHSGCQKCWSEEDAGLTSLRQFAEKWYPPVSDNFFMTFDNDIVENVPVYHLELRLGNFCNLKCIMCTEGSSSSVLAERVQHRELYSTIGIYPYNPRIEPWWEDWRFLDFCDQRLNRVKRINFTGGEPFIIPEVPKVLERIDKNVIVSFNTNLTRLNDQLINQLKLFNSVEIVISLEGVGPHNDYIRYPSNWTDIVHNLDYIRKQLPHALIGINHTLQHTSVYSLPNLTQWIIEQGLTFYMTTVQGFDYLTFDSVPLADLSEFQQWVNNTKHIDDQQREFLSNQINKTVYSARLNRRFQSYTDVLDTIRGTNFAQTFLK